MGKMMTKFLRGILRRVGGAFSDDLNHRLETLTKICQDLCYNQLFLGDPRYRSPKRLTRYEYQVFSQNGEDGILAEIFRRVGKTNKTFVEFGLGDGLESNTAALLLDGWRGLWIEGNPDFSRLILEHFRNQIQSRQLILRPAYVTPEDIEDFFQAAAIPRDLDLLSIDIDGNDFWLWKAIKAYTARVVVIEYNADLGPDLEWVMTYTPGYAWDGSSYFGASLKSLERLGHEKGYRLVGCNLGGVNAFFIREDLLGDHFELPFTSENHYEPLRPFLKRRIGHVRSSGMFV
jgi:hypothetical protein